MKVGLKRFIVYKINEDIFVVLLSIKLPFIYLHVILWLFITLYFSIMLEMKQMLQVKCKPLHVSKGA